LPNPRLGRRTLKALDLRLARRPLSRAAMTLLHCRDATPRRCRADSAHIGNAPDYAAALSPHPPSSVACRCWRLAEFRGPRRKPPSARLLCLYAPSSRGAHPRCPPNAGSLAPPSRRSCLVLESAERLQLRALAF